MRLQICTTEEQAAALETLAANSLLDVSDHVRQAIDWYLRQMNALVPRQMQNGKTFGHEHHEERTA
jgi:hypothetical protein